MPPSSTLPGASRVVVTFGTFDLFHRGHLNLLRRARALGTSLVVGVSSDALNMSKKQRVPYYPESDRMDIVRSVKGVDAVFLEEELALKPSYLAMFDAAVLVMGDDWEGRFDWVASDPRCPNVEVVYLPRTAGISSSFLIDRIRGGDI